MRSRLAGLQSPLRRPALPQTPAQQPHARALSTTPTLSARLIRRPRRPYTFTQLVQLSDGSTYATRTTSPRAIYRSTKDTRNHLLWQPSEKSLHNVELDEAGRLAAFRDRFGRGFDLQEGPGEDAAEGKKGEEQEYDLGDLISGYASTEAEKGKKK